MLKTRVIPTLLLKGHGLVKGKGFDSWRRIGSAMPAVKVYNRRDVDELVLFDIAATPESRGPDIAEIRALAAECFVPFSVGGGVRKLSDFEDLLRAGADKVCVNSAAYEEPTLILDAAQRFGSQCVVAAVDVRRNSAGDYECVRRCGATPTGITVVDWVARAEDLGAGEVIVTSIERDGTLEGYDLELIRLVAGRVSIPVVAAGGAGTYDHAYEAVCAGANAVAAGAMFSFTEQTPLEMKQFLASRGVATRLGPGGTRDRSGGPALE